MDPKPLTWNGQDDRGKPLLWNTRGQTWNGSLPQIIKIMPHLRVLLGFVTASDHSIEELTGSVLENLYGQPAYPNPPVTKAALQAALAAFTAAIAVQAQGGTAATADKLNKREALVALLRLLAGYVQENCGNNLATLLLSGFEAVSTNRASVPLEKPAILGVTNGNSGQLLVKATRPANTRLFDARYALVGPDGTPGPWVSGGLFTNSRAISLIGLTPGGLYQIQLRGVGGSTGYSDWSDPMQHMSL